MSHSPKKTAEIITSFCAALVLGAVVLLTQTNVISAQSSNFQGGSPEISQTPDMANIRILFPAGVAPLGILILGGSCL